MFRSISLLVLLGVSAFATLAQQRPLITDDIDITPPGSLSISIGADFLQNAKFPLSGQTGDLTRVADIRLRQGFASNVEIQIEGSIQNYLAINSQKLPSNIPLNIESNSTHDWDDFTFATKIRLLSEGEKRPGVGIKFGFQMPNTDQAKGIGTNQINIFTKFIVQKRFGVRPGRSPIANIYGNLGLGIMTAPLSSFTQNDVLLYGIAGVFRLNDRINLATELNGRVNTRSGDAPVGTESVSQFRVGAQVKASGLRFDTAAIFGIGQYSPRTGVTFGVTYETPPFFPIAK
ncbi:MAG: hypothetical protein ACJ72Z_02860 [Pyrinomonadaceae bacterium]